MIYLPRKNWQSSKLSAKLIKCHIKTCYLCNDQILFLYENNLRMSSLCLLHLYSGYISLQKKDAVWKRSCWHCNTVWSDSAGDQKVGQSSFDSICSRKETRCLYMIRFLPLLNRIGNRPWSTSRYMCCLLIPSSFAASESEYAWECSSGLWSSTAGRPYFIGFVRLMSQLALGVTNQCLSIVVKV